MDKIIQGLEQKIKELERYKSDYWRGVRDGYISSLDFIKQLNKQIEVLKVLDITGDPHIERELALIKVNAPTAIRSEIQAVIAPFRADIVDVAQKSIMIQVVGTHEKIDACIEVLRPYGLKQLARTGITGLVRG